MKENIKNTITELKSIQIAEAQLDKMLKVKKEQETEFKDLTEQITKRLKNIDALSKLSFTSIYERLVGNLTYALEMSKNHFLEISLRHRELRTSLDALEFEIGILQEKVSKHEATKGRLQDILKSDSSQAYSKSLKDYKSLLKKTETRLKLAKEIEEAIDQGVIINNQLNKIIKFVKTKAESIYDESKNKKKVVHFDIQKVSKYQDLMITVQHSLIKYEVEIADVYNEILQSTDHQNLLVHNFMAEYRMNLITDLKSLKGLNNSYVFLKNFKATIMSITRSLRSDLRKLRKEILELEAEENYILNTLKI